MPGLYPVNLISKKLLRMLHFQNITSLVIFKCVLSERYALFFYTFTLLQRVLTTQSTSFVKTIIFQRATMAHLSEQL